MNITLLATGAEEKFGMLVGVRWAAFCARMLTIPSDRVLLESDLCARQPALRAEKDGTRWLC